ncbi:hypothetical protein CY34DRAFT_399981 [Suillus luteus UH-Slu-Lm8-n1]|uniref:Unplaced genomic scaffold CY34scaffold_27, whole genome shotgun sequence n=1 Tax=Suillus luteus UH-Slu-Lm8-n1 TaxID=930992 RepID=A0A0D0BKK6_9AGAM|nr:hypothetical protein CY34DRAFT_399981 [Suillus luteus UH-Slu-Lm8-n1]
MMQSCSKADCFVAFQWAAKAQGYRDNTKIITIIFRRNDDRNRQAEQKYPTKNHR